MSTDLKSNVRQIKFKVVKSTVSDIYEFEDFRLDGEHLMLSRKSEELSLTPKQVETLLALVEKKGEIVSKDALMARLWGDSAVEESNLNQNIYILRKTLGKSLNGKPIIETFRRRGYRFNCDLKKIPQSEPAIDPTFEFNGTEQPGFHGEADPFADREPRLKTLTGYLGRTGAARTVVASIALLLFVACSIGYYFFFVRNNAPVRDMRSVAVLPFANETSNPDVDYLSDGISDSLIDRLSSLPGVKVIARSSSFAYKGKEAQPQEVANDLGVEAVITGRVTQRGESLFINVALVDGRDSTQLWGETYHRKAENLLTIQSEITRMVLEKLRLRLNTAEQKQLAKDRTTNPKAFELFLNGRFYQNKGGTENRKRAIDFYLQAIDADPSYALAYAELSTSYNRLINDNVLDPQTYLPKAEEAAIKSIELDDGLADSHLATAKAKQNAWDWTAAEQEFLRAIELNPNLAMAHVNYVHFLTIQGRYDSAIVEATRARELDPLSQQTNEVTLYCLLLQGKSDQALDAVLRMLQGDPSNVELYTVLGQIYSAKGQNREAAGAFLEAIKLGDNSPDLQIYLGAAYGNTGELKKTRSILHRLETGTEYVSPSGLAALHAVLGEREKAFELLERSFAQHDQQLIWLGVEKNGLFKSLSDDPRFDALLRRVGVGHQQMPPPSA